MTAIKFQNTWFNEVQLFDGEKIIFSCPSNHTQGKRAVGGKLFVTNQRIAFIPNRLDANMGGMALEVPVSEITSIGTDKPHFTITEIFSGAWRTRLAIHSSDRAPQYFVVNDPAVIASKIKTAVETLAEHDSGLNGLQP